MSHVAAGTRTATQIAGDCLVNQCDGNGQVVSVNDDTDLPVDGKQCTSDVCTSGVASNPALPAGTPCTDNGGTGCDGAGACVVGGCSSASSCPGTDTACQARACTAGICGFTYTPAGTVVANPTPGDCKADVCDGGGNIIVGAIDNSDVPADDGNECTLEVCNAGMPAHPPAPAGTACNQSGGSTCNGTGQCVTCTLDSQCTAGGPCELPKCSAGVCGFVAAPAGPLPAGQQTPGDCQQKQCDGASTTPISVADNTDVPADDG
jgi:hypothetical protein